MACAILTPLTMKSRRGMNRRNTVGHWKNISVLPLKNTPIFYRETRKPLSSICTAFKSSRDSVSISWIFRMEKRKSLLLKG